MHPKPIRLTHELNEANKTILNGDSMELVEMLILLLCSMHSFESP